MDEPLLCFIYLNGGSGFAVRSRTVYEPLAELFGLTQADQKRSRPDGHAGVHWHNRVQWERQRLINKGLLDGSTRGVWRLSPAGIDRASLVLGIC
ncbi:winged helix-turn-helix domain-containing protein [Candidatus Binatus sp.]